MKSYLIIFLFFFIGCINSDQRFEDHSISDILDTTSGQTAEQPIAQSEFIDFRGNKTYERVTIVGQTWMSQNLDAEYFQNGDKIIQAKSFNEWYTFCTNKKPCWMYYEIPDWYTDPPNGGKNYGKIYNYYAVHDSRNLAPKGWRIPSKYDFELLISNLGGWKEADKKLKSTSGWKPWRGSQCISPGTNESGFNVFPFGSVTVNDIDGLGIWTSFWTSTEKKEENPFKEREYILDENGDRVLAHSEVPDSIYLQTTVSFNYMVPVTINLSDSRKIGMSIRCIKN